MPEAIQAVRDFLERGGDVLLLILGTTLVMWTLILERYWFFRRVHPVRKKLVVEEWDERLDQSSWHAHQVRNEMISLTGQSLRRGIPMIKTLVALCPLLGLLGTVTGMIEVFDVMAIAGSGNARAMASGVSKAPIPTMAGLVAALSGLYFSVSTERFANDETERLADRLVRQ